ncbi:hypothetical protein [Marinobacter sp.]|uniref:hypothetical protein n=1 Tax=Marinobacter sp. TaxID=50741 RepID=UPI003A8CE2E7
MEVLHDAHDDLASYMVENSGAPTGFEVITTYQGMDNSAAVKMADDLVLAAKPAMVETFKARQADIEAMTVKQAQASNELEEIKASNDAIVAELNKMEAAANAVHNKAGSGMSALGEKIGYTGGRKLQFGECLNGSYRLIDFNGKSHQPESCPDISNYVSVDTRALTGQCAYVNIGSVFRKDQSIEKRVREILSSNFLDLPTIKEAIGEWIDREADTLYCKYNIAKSELRTAEKAAVAEFGSKRERNIAYRDKKLEIERLDYDIKDQQDEYSKPNRLKEAEYEKPEGYEDTFGDQGPPPRNYLPVLSPVTYRT